MRQFHDAPQRKESLQSGLSPGQRLRYGHQVTSEPRPALAHLLVLPTLLFAALGAMTWAVRGSSGYGGSAGCLFAGVTWGTAWWFISRDPQAEQSRPYSSGWVILALTIGIGIAGDRGWMQWASFFEGRLQTNYAKGEFVPISRAYGFLWQFLSGIPWAGIGACLLAWCAPARPLRAGGWVTRLICAFGAVLLARFLFAKFPDIFLPLHKQLATQYADFNGNPNLRRLINDNRNAIMHLGFYMGCLAFEIARRDWRNVTLITTVGFLNGIGWALLQNWKWAKKVWPGADFNFWRCWESSAGISIGIAYGLAYYLVNRPVRTGNLYPRNHPNLERLAAYGGLLLGLGLSIKNGLKGWANIYVGNEDYWSAVLWKLIGPLLLLGLLIILWRVRRKPVPAGTDPFPHAYALMGLVLITQNVLAQLVTGPWSSWNEVAFSLYYLVLFALSGVILHHFHCLRCAPANAACEPIRSDHETA
jgi:hypothetical protein